MPHKRILVADDNKDLLAAMGTVLIDEGYFVTLTNNGADALCLLAGKPPPDLLILDMVMPRLDGHEVLKALGPMAPPVVVITGERMVGQMLPEELTKGKVIRVLDKPFDKAKLMEAVRWAIQQNTPPEVQEKPS
jgi:CheY-like chemotaxis protein